MKELTGDKIVNDTNEKVLTRFISAMDRQTELSYAYFHL